MASNVWSSSGDTNGNTGSNWSLGVLSATDTLVFNTTSNVNCTFSTSITVAAISVTADYTGTITFGATTLTVGDITILGTVVLNFTDTILVSSGDLTLSVGCTFTTNTTSQFTFSKVGAVVTSGGKSLPKCTFMDNFTLNDTCTIARLIFGAQDKTGTFEAGQTFTITTIAASDWNGSYGLTTKFVSATPGTQYTFAIPNAITVTYTNPTDCYVSGFVITADDDTNVDGGNNTNWTFTANYSNNVDEAAIAIEIKDILNTYLTDPRALAGGTARSTWCHFDKPRTDATYPRIQIEQLPGTNDIISLGTNYSELTYCYYNIHFYSMVDFKITTRLNGVRVSLQNETLVSHYLKEIKNALKENQSITQALYIDGFKMLGTSKINFDPDTKLYHGFCVVRYWYFTQAI